FNCRAFEKLVANSHAGHFYTGRISIDASKGNFTFLINDTRLRFSLDGADGLGKIIYLKNRLFGGISFEEVHFELSELSLDFLRKFSQNFEIGLLHIRVGTDEQLETSLLIIDDLLGSKHAMILEFLPQSEKLVPLPHMEYLEIIPKDSESCHIPISVFLQLLNSQYDLYFSEQCEIIRTSNEWKLGMQIMSANHILSTRMTSFFMKCSTIVECLRDYGISSTAKDGERYGEFEILSIEGPSNDVTVHFRYDRCWIRVVGLAWTGGDSLCSVTMETNLEWQI
ncbi:hypothetical protein PENTCL1PPCAC_20414, partial [Pristionchus entomophagus]